jgi:hypothetical protein
MKHPKRWQDSKPFVKALAERGYVQVKPRGREPKTCLAEGVYLYMYELWQDGAESAPHAGTLRLI